MHCPSSRDPFCPQIGEYGARLDYTSKPKYQDLWAFILFYVHVVLILVLCIIWWSSIDDSSDSDATTSPAPTVWWYTDSDTDTDSSTDFGDFSITGVLVALLAAVVAGSMFGCLWLQCIRTFPASIIKIMLVVQITAWVIVAIVGIAADIMALCIIALIIAAIYGLYTWW